jgi:hypothetical protein
MLALVRSSLLVLAIAIGVGAVALPPAPAADVRYDYSAPIRLSANRPAKPFGLVFGYVVRDVSCGRNRRCFNPDVQPGDKPKNPVEIKIHLPRGTKYNRDGAVICSYAKAIRTGPDRCPRGSLLGTGVVGYDWRPYSAIYQDLWIRAGTLEVVHAFGKVRHPDRPNVELLGDGLGVFMDLTASFLRNPLFAYTASMSRRGELTITLPTEQTTGQQITDPFGVIGVLTGFGFRIRKNAQQNGTPLLRTPRRCVPQKGWKTKIVVTYEDNSTKTFVSRHPCHRG